MAGKVKWWECQVLDKEGGVVETFFIQATYKKTMYNYLNRRFFLKPGERWNFIRHTEMEEHKLIEQFH